MIGDWLPPATVRHEAGAGQCETLFVGSHSGSSSTPCCPKFANSLGWGLEGAFRTLLPCSEWLHRLLPFRATSRVRLWGPGGSWGPGATEGSGQQLSVLLPVWVLMALLLPSAQPGSGVQPCPGIPEPHDLDVVISGAEGSEGGVS